MTLPAKSIYLMDETPVDTFEIFEALNLVKVFGAETSENEILSKGLADGSVLYGGSWDGKQRRLSYFSGNRPTDHKIFRCAE